MADSLSPTQAPLKELIERRLELSEELRNGLAGVIAKQDEELKLLRAVVSALSPHPPTSEEHFWEAVANGWDIEPREYFEREAVAMGFKSPVEMAVHHMWKRHAKDWPNAELKLKGSPHPPSEEQLPALQFRCVDAVHVFIPRVQGPQGHCQCGLWNLTVSERVAPAVSPGTPTKED